jgi:regulator of replication initiation timing
MSHDERCACHCAERALAQAQEEIARLKEQLNANCLQRDALQIQVTTLRERLEAVTAILHQDHTAAPFERCRAATCKLARAALGMP